LKRLASEYRKRGLKVVGVSIGHAPTDRLDKMIARSAMSKYNFPYCIDLTQRLGRRYGATCTPHAFLLDARRRVAYMGAIDDNVAADKIEFHYLRDAVTAVLEGKRPEVSETLQKGCEIKYVSR
jgi:alkyl hydroperoxide reductase subunit AhpC